MMPRAWPADLLARWQAAEDKEGEYAAICEELGQEAGSAVTLAAVEGDPLSDAIAALEEGGMDAVIDPYEDGTCYVVMRTETDMSAVAQTYFDVLWEQRVQDAVVVVNTKLYDTIDTGAFYEKLTQLRAGAGGGERRYRRLSFVKMTEKRRRGLTIFTIFTR